MVTRELYMNRIFHDAETTQGALIDPSIKKMWGFIIEDQPQPKKVAKETRIPAGRYKLIINKTLTDKTKEYIAKYPWFKFHIQLENVPGFQGIYIHIGNNDKDTDGCLLMNHVIRNMGVYANTPGAESTECFKAFYLYFYPLLESGQDVYINVQDENY